MSASRTSPIAGVAMLALAGVLASCVTACGGAEAPPPKVVQDPRQPSWQDAFDGTPEVLGVVRPRVLQKDGVYGKLFTTAVRAALARSALSGSSAIEILESCDDVVFGMTRSPDTGREAGMLVLRGVSAAHDPAKLVDERGAALFRLRDDRSRVPEYAPASGAPGALFVLPERVWVVTMGDATARARQAFATPMGRPQPSLDREALAYVRVGPEIAAAPRYAKSPVFGALVRRIEAVGVALDPGGAGARLVLSYGEEDAAALGEMHAKRIAAELARVDPKKLGWLEGAVVTREAKSVTVRLPVPPRLLEELPKAGAGDVLGP